MSVPEEFVLALVKDQVVDVKSVAVPVPPLPLPPPLVEQEKPCIPLPLVPALVAPKPEVNLSQLVHSTNRTVEEDDEMISSSSSEESDPNDKDYVYEGRRKVSRSPKRKASAPPRKKTRLEPYKKKQVAVAYVVDKEIKKEHSMVSFNRVKTERFEEAEAEDNELLSGIPTPQECLAERRRMAEYYEILRVYGEDGVDGFDFLQPPVTPVVLNVVASASIGMTLDLKKVITLCQNVEYNPRRFAPCVMRIRKPRSTCLIFASGRMIVSGCKSERDAYIAVRRYVRILQKNVEPSIKTVKTYEIQNMSASCTLPFGLTLRNIAEGVMEIDCPHLVSYEPELFPGLVWNMTEPKARIVLFCGGAILFTGLKSEEELHKSFKLIYPLCRKCRRY